MKMKATKKLMIGAMMTMAFLPFLASANGFEPLWRDFRMTAGPFDTSNPSCIPALVNTSKLSSVAVEPGGDVYVGCAGGGGWRIVKWSPSTKSNLWDKMFPISSTVKRIEIGLDSAKSVYMTGPTVNTLIHTIKLDSNGNQITNGLWPKNEGGSSVFVDKNDFVYLNNTFSGGYQVYKFDTAGNQISNNIISSRSIIDIYVDKLGFVYLLSMGPSGESIVEKYKQDGSLVASWGSGGVATSSDILGNPKSLVIDEVNGRAFVVGNTLCCGTWNGFVIKFDTAGNTVSSYQLGSSGGSQSATVRARDVVLDSQGNAYVVGYAGIPVANQGGGGTSTDVSFIAKFNNSLQLLNYQLVKASDVDPRAIANDKLLSEGIAINPAAPDVDKIFIGGFAGQENRNPQIPRISGWVPPPTIMNGPFGMGLRTDTAPLPPQNLSISAGTSPATCKALQLTWSANSELDIKQYNIYRNSGSGFVKIGQALVGQNSYSDPNLIPGQSYSYQIVAEDRNGNLSSTSNTVSGTPANCPDTTPPSVPTALSASAGATCHDVDLSWSAVADNAGGTGLKGYNIYRNGAFVAQVPAGTTTYTDSGRNGSTLYSYQVDAEDNAGNKSAKSASRSVTTSACVVPDATPPSIPSISSVNNAACGRLQISWNASTDNIAVAGYNIYRNGSAVKLNSALITTTSYTDVAVVAGTSYSYKVQAVDTSNNTSALSTSLAGTPRACPDTTNPGAPTVTVSLGLGGLARSCSEVDVSWTASSDPESGIASYELWRSTNGSAFTKQRTFLSGSPEFVGRAFADTGLSAITAYSYTVRAVNGAGLWTDSAPQTTTTTSCTAPPATSDLIISIAPTLNTGTLTEGFNTTFKATVKNLGPNATPQSFSNKFYIDLNSDGTLDIPLTVSPDPLPALAKDGVAQIISGVWNAIAGRHRVVACADDPNTIPETNASGTGETNNCSNFVAGGQTQGTGIITVAKFQQF